MWCDNFGFLFAKVWPEKITSRDGCFSLIKSIHYRAQWEEEATWLAREHDPGKEEVGGLEGAVGDWQPELVNLCKMAGLCVCVCVCVCVCACVLLSFCVYFCQNVGPPCSQSCTIEGTLFGAPWKMSRISHEISCDHSPWKRRTKSAKILPKVHCTPVSYKKFGKTSPGGWQAQQQAIWIGGILCGDIRCISIATKRRCFNCSLSLSLCHGGGNYYILKRFDFRDVIHCIVLHQVNSIRF